MQANKVADKINDTHTQAKEARAFAVSLEANPNDVEASKQWHAIADCLFDAVAIYDKMANRSNGVR
jgi:endo-beta-N-acetylglucosaminidase D